MLLSTSLRRTVHRSGHSSSSINTMKKYELDYLEQLEAESIFVMRQVAAQFEKPALLFSGGKDSITLVQLAKKAFAPGKIPFPLLHPVPFS